MESADHKEGPSIKIICNSIPVEVKSKKDLPSKDDKTDSERPYNDVQSGASTQDKSSKSNQPILGALQDAVRKNNKDVLTTDPVQLDYCKEPAKSTDSSYENQKEEYRKPQNEPVVLNPDSIQTTPSRRAKPQNEPKDVKPESIETTTNRRAKPQNESKGLKPESIETTNNRRAKSQNEFKDLKPESIETTTNRRAKTQNEFKDLKPESIETTTNRRAKTQNEPKDLEPESIQTTPNERAKPQNEPKDLKPDSIQTTPNRRANISTQTEDERAVLKYTESNLSPNGTKIYDNGSGISVKQDSLPDGSNINKNVNKSIKNFGPSKTNINQKMKVFPDAKPPQTKTIDSPSSVDRELAQMRKRSMIGARSTKSMPSIMSQKSTISMKDKARVIKDVVLAICVRFILICHSVVCVWRTTDILKNNLYWLLAITNVLLLIETFYRVRYREGKDPKWICPCFLLYLAGTVPSIWLQKLDQLESATSMNGTNNSSQDTQALSSFQGITVPIYLDDDTWLEVLQQILLFILVIGRLLLPLSHVSRDELSQMLFIFIGSGSDAMELFVVFEEDAFKKNMDLRLATLTIWSVSLLQFVFLLTTAKGPKRFRLGTITDGSIRSNFKVELAGLLMSMILMDGPYLGLRLYAMIEHKVLSYGILFFTCKNVLMLILEFYRLRFIVNKIRSKKTAPYTERETDSTVGKQTV